MSILRMPAFKLTKDLFLQHRVNSSLLQIVSESAEKDHLNNNLLQLFKVENAKEQIEILKKVTKEIIQRVKSKPDLDSIEVPLRFLVHIFFISTSKNPSRRVLISHFQGLPENVKETVIGPAIKDGLQNLCNQPIREANSTQDLGSFFQLRHNVDAISALIENFPFGEDCVREICLEILIYLGKVQDCLFHCYGAWLSPVHQNEMMHHCLETVKLANRICQKSSVTLETKLKEVNAADLYRQVVTRFITVDIRVLETDDFLLDCKTTSAMNIWLFLKHCINRDCLIYLASRSVFKHVDWLVKSCDSNKLPDWLEDLNFSHLTRSNLITSAFLCGCYGFLAMVAMETLLLSIGGKCLLLDVLLHEFLDLSKSCSDIGGKLLAAKSVCFLTQKIRDHLNQEGTISPEIQERLHGDSNDMKAILDFVWTSWEDSVDAIRFTVKDIFENVVAVHLQSSADRGNSVKDDPLLRKLAESILNDVNWSCKGKYPTLSVLISHVGSTRMLVLHPGIAEEILQQMQEQTLACYACDLYEKLFKSHQEELTTSQSESSAWFHQWLDPVLAIICGNNDLQKKHIIEYVLPKLLKTGTDTLQYIIQRLSGPSDLSESQQNEHLTSESITGGKLGALIICLRRARALGLLKSQSHSGGGENDSWCGVVEIQLLQQALICKDDQTRLDAFALLCENQKTSETASETEIRLIRCFIPQNLNNQNPAFRQHFLSHLKKFLSRMKESHTALKRRSGKEKTPAENMKQYKDFLCWLTRCLFSKLYPGSVFARRTTCLSALVLLKDTFGEQFKGSEDTYDFFTSVRECDLNTLLFCLTDTFEDNKRDSASLLIACAVSKKSPVLKEHIVKELFDIGLSLSQSTRPQDSTTAAYLFSVLTHQHSLHRILTLHIEIDQCAQNVKSEENVTQNTNVDMCSEPDGTRYSGQSQSKEFKREKGLNAEKAESGSDKGKVGIESEYSLDRRYIIEDSDLTKRYMLLSILMRSLESQAEVAKTSLILAAANRPLYPTIQCMRYCCADIDFRKIPEDSIQYWKGLVARLMSLCFEISGVVSPVVCNSSPEGNVPVDALTGFDNLDLGDSENLTKSKETVMLMPEYLIVCCWRSVKEISLLLGQLTSSLPNVSMVASHGLLTYNQILQVGEFFTTLLLESKHRGAFELAYAGFVKVTDMLWRSSISELHQLPSKWLSEVMVDILSGNPESRLCATRRSAGVPFYIQALVTTEPSSTGRQCFRQTMQELLTLAADETVVLQEKSTAKVHALNILRALYKDSRLKDDVAPFVADGLKVAILGFKSPLWAVRNSATLLMTAMMTRIFGVKRSKDETTFSRKNCQTGRTFFYNYPSLYQFLLEQVAMATENVTSQLHPGLFPILMVLGRLFPSAMEGTDTSLNLAAFIPYVIKCSANPVLKTRVMAAKALQPLVEKDHVMSVFRDLLTLLPCQPTDVMRQNQIHGVLLQVLQLCKTIPLLPVTVQSRLEVMIGQMWKERMLVLISRHNRCLATRTLGLEVTHSLMQQFHCQDFIHTLSRIIGSEIESFDTVYDKCTPTLSEFHTTVCTLYCNLFLSNSLSDDICVRPPHSDSCVRPSQELLQCETEESSQLTSSPVRSLDKCSSSCDQLSNNLICDKDNTGNIEDVIVKCLNSKSYEVRQTVMEKLTEVFSGSERSGDVALCSGKEDYGKSTGETKLDVRLSSALLTPLLARLHTEKHEECKIQLLRLLETRMVQLAMFNVEVSALLQIVHKMLMELTAHTCSDTLTASIITFTGVTLYHLFERKFSQTRSKPQSSEPSEVNDGKDIVTVATIVAKFISTIRGYTEHMETSSEVLLACAQALVLNRGLLAGKKSLYISTDQRLYIDTVRSVLDLLQADDLEVRETSIAIVTALSSEKAKVFPHPYVAMAQLLDHVCAGGLESNTGLTVPGLLAIIVERKEENNDHEERLFDRGEMNTYWDELDFVQTLDSAVSKYMQSKRFMQKTSAKTTSKETERNEIAPVHDNSKSPYLSHIKTVVEDFLLHIKEEGWDTSTDALTLKNVFYDTSAYQESVLTTYKTLIMCKYGKLFVPESNCEISPIVQQTLDKLKGTCSSLRHVWLSIVHDLMTELHL